MNDRNIQPANRGGSPQENDSNASAEKAPPPPSPLKGTALRSGVAKGEALPKVLTLEEANSTAPDAPVPEEPTVRVNTAPAHSASNVTSPGLGAKLEIRRNITAPMPMPMPMPMPAAPISGMPPSLGAPSSDPFVENAITAPLSPEVLANPHLGPSIQVHESRGRDGAAHVAIAMPAPRTALAAGEISGVGQMLRPAEPLVVVDVSTDPTNRSLTSITAPRPSALADEDRTAIAGTPIPRAKFPMVLVLCIFGACLILAVGIVGTLVAKYLPRSAAAPAASAAPVKPSARTAAVAAPANIAAVPAPEPVASPPETVDPVPPPAKSVAPKSASGSSRTTNKAASGRPAPSASTAPRHAGELERGIE